VADVVDAVKHLHKTVMTNWSSEPMTLMDPDEVGGRFFIRVKDMTPAQVEEIFGQVKTVSLESLPGELGAVTSSMKQGEYKEKAAKLGEHLITMIRVKG
jgi:homoserine dehydrogenase